MTPKTLYEDNDLLVLEKPAGMIVNKADTAKGLVTLQDFVNENYPITSVPKLPKEEYIVDGYNKYDEFVSRSGIVHRLDKETSGVILVAKNVETFINLQEQFKSGKVKKIYTTLLHGKLENETGEVNEPIGRLPWNRMRFGVFPQGRAAHTIYKVLSFKKHADTKDQEVLSFVEVYPQTGRTHQIRVHFQFIKHPVYGDELYAGRKTGRDDRKKLNRHFLHASKISLLSPTTNVPVTYESPLPEELDKFFETLVDA